MDADVQVLTHRVTALEDTLGEVMREIRDGIKEIATNTGKLTILEERHSETRDALARAFAEISRVQESKCDVDRCTAAHQSLEDRAIKAEARISAIETVMPGLKELRTWVLTIAGIIIMAVVGALIALVVK
jgi:chromosome segregation ATPase